MNVAGHYKSPGRSLADLGKPAQIVVLSCIFVLVVLCVTFLLTKADLVTVSGLIVAGFLVLGLLYWPEAGTVLVIFVIYSNLAVVGYKFHGLPQVLVASVPLLLGIPLTVYWFVRREKFIIDYTWMLMLGFLVALFASLIMSKDVGFGVEWITTYVLEGLLLYLIIINVLRKYSTLRSAIWALLLAGALLGSLTLIQELTHQYNNNFGGLAQRNTERWEGESEGGSGVFREREKVRLANRAGGPIGGPNRYGQIMLVLLPLGLFRVLDEKDLNRKLLAALCTLFILAGMLLTYSRGAFLCFGLLVVIVTFMRYIRLSHILVSVVLAVLLISIASPGYLSRMDSIRNVTALFTDDASIKADGATRGRVTEMLAAFNAFLDYPLVGVGPGQYSKYYSVDYMADPQIAFRQIDKSRRAHTLYFELAAETGILGILTFMSIAIYLLFRLWRLRRRFVNKRPELANMATAFWLSLVAYLTSAVFLQLSYQRYYWLLTAFAGATVIILERSSQADDLDSETTLVT